MLIVVVVFVSFITSAYFPHQSLSIPKIKINKNTIVFLGNSITQVGKWQELIPNKKVINKGISGDITTGVLARIEDCLLEKPAKIFVMIGINDLKIGKVIDSITANQIRIIEKIRRLSPRTKIYMQSTLPVNEGMLASIYKRLNNADIAKMNTALKFTCKEKRVTFIDLHPIMIDENAQLKYSLSTDGLHLKPEAYLNWVNYLKTNKFL
ncbi:MAG: GDSL family lipase [Ferruginibacter sp.]|nr:GDSL family lipase [Ferruginibacter sp.]